VSMVWPVMISGSLIIGSDGVSFDFSSHGMFAASWQAVAQPKSR
jgi:hypothetical protein